MATDPPQLPTRFVSQSEIERTNAKKEEAWKAAYARIGQEPPVRSEVDEKYDGRSLAEKLAANRAAKQEEFENSHKLSAQFRSLDPDEITFLDEVAVRRMEEDKKVREGDEEALRGFRAAVQARDIAPPIPIPGPSSSSTSPTLSKSHSDTLPTMGSGSGASMESTSATKNKAKSPPVNKSIPPDETQPPTSKNPQAHAHAPAPPPAKKRPIKAGLKGVVVQRKRSKAAGGDGGGGAVTVSAIEEGAVPPPGGGGAIATVSFVGGRVVRAPPAIVEFPAGGSVKGPAPVGGTSMQGHGDGDGPVDGDGDAEGGDRKRRRVE